MTRISFKRTVDKIAWERRNRRMNILVGGGFFMTFIVCIGIVIYATVNRCS